MQWCSDIEYCVFNKSSAIKYCDKIICEFDQPPYEIIELSLMAERTNDEIRSCIYSFCNSSPTIANRYLSLLKILESVNNNDDFWIIRNATFSFLMNYREQIPDEIQRLIYTVDHYIDDGCLENGYVTENQILEAIFELKNRLLNSSLTSHYTGDGHK